MSLTKPAAIAAIALALAGCDAVFDPGPPKASEGPTFLFEPVAVRPALEVCDQFDQAFSRSHTVTVAGERVSVKSTGGVEAELPRVAPGIFRTQFSRDNLQLVVAFDAQRATRTLMITEVRNGCRWIAESRGTELPGWWQTRWPDYTGWWR